MKTAIPLFIGASVFFSHTSFSQTCEQVLAGTAKDYTAPCIYLGAYAELQNNYYKQSNSEYFPAITALWRYVYIDGSELGMYFAGDSKDDVYWYSSLHLAYEEAPYKHLKSEYSDKKLNQDDATMAGFGFAFGSNWGHVVLRSQSDLSDTYNGHEISLNYRYLWQYKNLQTTPFVGTRYLDNNKAEYLLSHPSLINRDTPKSGAEFLTGVNFIYNISAHWSLYQLSEYQHLSDDLSQMSLVKSKQAWSALFGINYLF
ncbi:MipA/OmpV family protein [Agaribacterium sp. ZY112]|uniref:MipA/OmpV family protein n=1 Tax=Agaribacterium sp. ZY112 TaxID=3233574 RepID=UPI003523149D